MKRVNNGNLIFPLHVYQIIQPNENTTRACCTIRAVVTERVCGI